MKIDNQFGQFHRDDETNLVVNRMIPVSYMDKFSSNGTIHIHVLDFVKDGEVVFGMNGKYIYFYRPETFTVEKFGFSVTPSGKVNRDNAPRRTSPDFMLSILNTPKANLYWKSVVLPSLKRIFPERLVNRYGRGPGLSTKDRGVVNIDRATHFDIYLRRK